MVRPPGFEPGTYGLEGRCSIQLSYERIGSISGTPERSRTSNLRIRSPLLYPIELRAHFWCALVMGWMTGLEPATPRATTWCSNQLSYTHHLYQKISGKKQWSGRRDLNPRPPGPKPGALTRLRYAPLCNRTEIICKKSIFVKRV